MPPDFAISFHLLRYAHSPCESTALPNPPDPRGHRDAYVDIFRELLKKKTFVAALKKICEGYLFSFELKKKGTSPISPPCYGPCQQWGSSAKKSPVIA
jgi:hypothetical protein